MLSCAKQCMYNHIEMQLIHYIYTQYALNFLKPSLQGKKKGILDCNNFKILYGFCNNFMILLIKLI